ncbi:MAG: monovalent cation/H+ antiporter subunit D family protein [Gammaproteobacteria bacterium]
MAGNLPALQVIIPLLAAPLALMLRRGNLGWLWAQLVCLASLGVSIALLRAVLSGGPISYEMGGWAPPWGIEYYVDAVNAFVLLIVTGIATVVMLAAGTGVGKEISENKQPQFYTAYLLCLAGLLGITITGDAFNVFVFLEISSLSTYILVSLGNDRRALTAAFQYLIMGTIGATFFLIGVGMLYMMTGTLNMHDLAVRLDPLSESRTVQTAFAFITVGISLKLALFPLHLWLPNAYTYAPSIASALLAATATKVAVYVMLRFIFTVFGLEFSFQVMPLGIVLLVLALFAVFAGSLVAVFQYNVKRLFAYSSVAQIGYMILGISFASQTGLTAAILHLFNHALMKGALFLALAALFFRTGGVRMENFRGLGRTMPLTMLAIVIGGLSLIGVPLTVGFVSKWYLVLAALEQGLWPVAFLVLVGSLIAVMYVWKLVEAAYFQEPEGEAVAVREAPLMLLIPTWILVLANIYFGIDTSLTVGVAEQAAAALLGSGGTP